MSFVRNPKNGEMKLDDFDVPDVAFFDSLGIVETFKSLYRCGLLCLTIHLL